MNKYLEKNLIYLRKKSNLTQAQLASILNYTPQAVSRWERGESIPDVNTLMKIADYYHISLDDLLNKPQYKEKISEDKHMNYLYYSILTILVLSIIGLMNTFYEIPFKILRNIYQRDLKFDALYNLDHQFYGSSIQLFNHIYSYLTFISLIAISYYLYKSPYTNKKLVAIYFVYSLINKLYHMISTPIYVFKLNEAIRVNPYEAYHLQQNISNISFILSLIGFILFLWLFLKEILAKIHVEKYYYLYLISLIYSAVGYFIDSILNIYDTFKDVSNYTVGELFTSHFYYDHIIFVLSIISNILIIIFWYKRLNTIKVNTAKALNETK